MILNPGKGNWWSESQTRGFHCDPNTRRLLWLWNVSTNQSTTANIYDYLNFSNHSQRLETLKFIQMSELSQDTWEPISRAATAREYALLQLTAKLSRKYLLQDRMSRIALGSCSILQYDGFVFHISGWSNQSQKFFIEDYFIVILSLINVSSDYGHEYQFLCSTFRMGIWDFSIA